MKQLLEFLKTTAVGGLFVLMPILLLYLLLSEALDLIVTLATPIADLFPKGTFEKVEFPVILGLILILGVSFLIGLGLRSEKGRSLGRWIERTVLGRLPAYKALKRLTSGFAEAGKDGAFRAAVLISDDGERQLAYVIEDHADGHVTVLLPWAPAAFAGPVKIVDRKRVELLDANLADVSKVLSHWGVGARDLLGKDAAGVSAAAGQKNGCSDRKRNSEKSHDE
jgi:uncharacterized membrane protein